MPKIPEPTFAAWSGEPSGAEMVGRPVFFVAETGERFSGVITAAEETENGWQYTLQQHPLEAPELHA
ncbi:hypothetical protein [Streptomyces sp. CBG31]|uniref:hypothetical protein n=1 Tax=Streptomyces sp. CBG31 TaxID=2762623 RepID=UPI001EFD70C6|nr:hypothetical protein [Streptomyces sp. CBG31]